MLPLDSVCPGLLLSGFVTAGLEVNPATGFSDPFPFAATVQLAVGALGLVEEDLLLRGNLGGREGGWSVGECRDGYPMLLKAAALSGSILLIMGMASAMAWALTQSGFSAALVERIGEIPGGAIGFMLVSILTFMILGSVLEGIPAIVLFGPVMFPLAEMLGIHPVHYAMVITLAMGIGLFAPPLGVGFYAACAIGKVPSDGVINKVWGYLAALVVALIIVASFPWISIGFL